MPLYEYRCETCGEQEEKLQGFSAPTEHACPTCGAVSGMHRQISVTAFTLAGGGWHAQGYAHPSEAKETASPAKAEPSTPAAASPAPSPAPPAGGGCGGGCGCQVPKAGN